MVGGWMLCFVAALVGARALRRARPALLAVALPRYDRGVAYLVANCVSLTWSITLPLTSTLALALALYSPNLNLALS